MSLRKLLIITTVLCLPAVAIAGDKGKGHVKVKAGGGVKVKVKGPTVHVKAPMVHVKTPSVRVKVKTPRVVMHEVHVKAAPPPRRIERTPPRPSPGHVFVAGHWTWRGGAHVWANGVWLAPPQPKMVWRPARWTRTGAEYVFVDGYWGYNTPPSATVVWEPPAPAAGFVVNLDPPADIVEEHDDVPAPDAVWINGYWSWDGGRHVWVAGHWSAPSPGHVWVPHRWQRNGAGGWVMVSGHWQ